jgi:hypothetical protein
MGIYYVVMIIFFTYLIITVWPEEINTGNGTTYNNSFNLFGFIISVNPEARIILLVILASALGSYVQAATSFVTYVGNRSLVRSWIWWYILRPFLGVPLAIIFYFVIRAGLLSTGTSASDVSLYGIAGISGLVGMFSKQATNKLEELFGNLFKTEKGKGDDVRKDKLNEKSIVEEKMIPFNKISSQIIPEGKSEKDIKITDLHNLLSDTVTRIPVFDSNGSLKYIIHQSILFKFVLEESIEAAKNKESFDVNSLTLEKFLSNPEIKKLVVDSIAFVSKDTTLLMAKEQMEKIKSCQDVFITETGSREEKILGWLTNIEISKYLTV